MKTQRLELNERFRSADKVERVRLEQKDQQFLYENDGMLVFMDSETYEQTELPSDLLGERRPFLQDGMTVKIEYYEEEALSCQLPEKVTCKIVETEPRPPVEATPGGIRAATGYRYWTIHVPDINALVANNDGRPAIDIIGLT